MVQQHQPETRWTIDLLEQRPEARILEIGCGAGYASKILLKQYKNLNQVVGIDISPISILAATFRNRNATKRGAAKFMQCDVKDIPFDNDYFNDVFSIQSIYFWDDLPRAISEIYRILKIGGNLIITLSNGKDGEVWGGIDELLDTQVIPFMKQNEFNNIEKLPGPSSRGYNTITVKGTK